MRYILIIDWDISLSFMSISAKCIKIINQTTESMYVRLRHCVFST